jgi:heme A synthase
MNILSNGLIGLLVVTWINKDASRKIRFTSSFASALVITQITLGAIVIDTKLHAVLVAVHLGIGILLFAMVLLTVIFAFRLGKKSILHTKT